MRSSVFLPSCAADTAARRAMEEAAAQHAADVAAQYAAEAAARERYAYVAAQFNRDLAGRYPFGPLETPDVNPAALRDFLHAHADTLTTLRDFWAPKRGQRYDQPVAFLSRLIKALPTLRALSDNAGNVRLAVHWKTHPQSSTGTEQLIRWDLLSAAQQVSFPSNRPKDPPTIDWSPGQPLVLDLTWADQSRYRPNPGVPLPGLTVEGPVASFTFTGNWAVLRLLERRVHLGAPSANLDPKRATLGFEVPLLTDAETPSAPLRAYLDFELFGFDAKTQELVPLVLPLPLPRVAPPFNDGADSKSRNEPAAFNGNGVRPPVL